MDMIPPADSNTKSWVHIYAPHWARPYLSLARLDRPVGIWLLFWPCAWGATLANLVNTDYIQCIVFLFLFFIGSVVMRSAGCVWNDIMDKDLDRQVERTKLRPLASGILSVEQAAIFMVCLCSLGLIVLLFFNRFTFMLGLASIVLVCIYPLAKRFTHWPQLVLGLTFNWGVFMGWAAFMEGLAFPAFALYLAGISWTLGYDTIYAHQDQRDDAIAGIGSTAQYFGQASKQWVLGFYGMAVVWLLIAALSLQASIFALIGIALFAAHLIWQSIQLDTDNADNCLMLFKSNAIAGAWVVFGFLGASFL